MLIKGFQSKYVASDVLVECAVYDNGRIALRLLDNSTGEPLAIATVNLPDEPLGPDEVFLKGWSENQGIPEALVAAGVVGPVLRRVAAGFCNATAHKLIGEFTE